MSEAACGYPRIPLRLSARFDADIRCIETDLGPSARQALPRTAGIESHPASESAAGTQRRLPRMGTTRRIPEAFAGNPRRPQDVSQPLHSHLDSTCCAYEREVDTLYPQFLAVVENLPLLDTAVLDGPLPWPLMETIEAVRLGFAEFELCAKPEPRPPCPGWGPCSGRLCFSCSSSCSSSPSPSRPRLSKRVSKDGGD